MEIIELTAENIEQYLDDCLAMQTHLIKPGEPINPAQFQKTAASTNTYFIGILDTDRLVGLGLYNYIFHPVRTNAHIDNIVVHPDVRGRGLFSMIMTELERHAKAHGVDQVSLTCSRPEVQKLYEKIDYVHKDTNFYYKNI